MNNVDIMVRLMEADPDTVTGVCMLVDALMEERDMTRSEADRYAERVQQSARDARDVAAAEELLLLGTETREKLLDLITFDTGGGTNAHSAVVVVPGTAGPEVKTSHPIGQIGGYFVSILTVGALWVLDAYRWRCPSEPPQKLRRGTSKGKK